MTELHSSSQMLLVMKAEGTSLFWCWCTVCQTSSWAPGSCCTFFVSVLLPCDKWNLQNHTYCGTGTSILSGEWSVPEAKSLGCVYICGGSCNNYSKVIITKAKVLRLWLQMSNKMGNKGRLRKEKGPSPVFSSSHLITTSSFSAFVLLAPKAFAVLPSWHTCKVLGSSEFSLSYTEKPQMV